MLPAFLNFLKSGVFLLVIPCGMAVFLWINKLVSGDWFQYVTYQKEHWYNTPDFPMNNIKRYVISAMTERVHFQITEWIPFSVLLVTIAVLFLKHWGRMRSSYLVYILTYLALLTSASWCSCGARYIAGLFPIYILFALEAEGSEWKDTALTVSFSVLTCFYVLAFTRGASVL